MKIMDKKLYFYYDFAFQDEKVFGAQLREFIDNGVRDFVLSDPMMKRICEDHGTISMLHNVCRIFEVGFGAAHAPYGKTFDLNVPEPEVRKALFKHHVVCMNAAAGFGCRTYTMHVGAWHSICEHVPVAELRPLAVDMLEKLLPYAEQAGIIIAVENSFEIPNSPSEVKRIVDHFAGSSNIGVCFDSGHANCMLSGPDKTDDKYPGYMRDAWWENGIIHEDDPLGVLGNDIVTCHLHDNNGFSDQHALPGDGTVDWNSLVPRLKSLPRIMEYQTEVSGAWGCSWAGSVPAPAGGYSIKRQKEVFTEKGF